jgi:hypothetical protein
METQLAIAGVIGVGATMAMDVWNLFLRRAFRIPSLDYCLLGRWVRHMPGTFRHDNITASPSKRFECATGWLAHYTIGVSLAVVFVLIVSADWLARPTLEPALLYGVATLVFPFFVLQPSLGLGVASARTANPTLARLKSLGTHTVFGVALYGFAVGIDVLRAAG